MDATSKSALSLGIMIAIVVCKFLYTDCISFKKYDIRRYRCVPNGTTFRADNVPSSHACGKLCHKSKQCTSFSYQPDMLRCIGCRRAIKSYFKKGGFVQYSSKSECPNGWIKNKDSCYYIHKEYLYYPEIESLSRQLDAHVVHLETQDENAFLKGLLMNHRDEGSLHSYWIGTTPNDLPVVNFEDYCDSNPRRYTYKCTQFFHACSFGWLTVECNTTTARTLFEV